MRQPAISVRFRLKTAIETETNEVDVKQNFLVFENSSVLTLKPLVANHKTANLMLKLKMAGAQSQLLSCYAPIVVYTITSNIQLAFILLH